MPKRKERFLVLVLAFLLASAGLYNIWSELFFTEIQVPKSTQTASPIHLSSSQPVRIEIPSIKINTNILPMGLTSTGIMESPEGPSETGWFSPGANPGDKGSAVIAGHRGFRSGPAVFDNLHQVKEGDEIIIENKAGERLVFIVREKRVYGAKELVPEVWEKNDKSYLNLITCSGKWNRLTQTSDERLVVFTELQM